MAFTNVYDTTFPPDQQAANQLGLDLRNFRLDVQQRMNAISGLDAAKPTFNTDAQPSNWNGVLFFAIDTGKIYQWNNPTWTDVSTTILLPRALPRYPFSGATTAASLAVLYTLSIPAGTLTGATKSFGRIVVSLSATGGALALLTINGTQIAVFTTIADMNFIIPTNTTITTGGFQATPSGTLSNQITSLAIPDISANALTIQVVQSGAGTLTGYFMNVDVHV